MIAGFVLILGIMIGSFLNVCIYRIPRQMPIGNDRSRCPQCGHTLGVLDLIPVLTYIFSKGKCRHCGCKVSSRYPIIELVTGLIFLFSFMRYGCTYELFFVLFMMSILIVIFMIDIDYRIIPNSVVLTSCVVGVVLQYLVFTKGYSVYYSTNPYGGLIGLAVMLVINCLIYMVSFAIYRTQAGIGLGDVKFYIPLSLFLGWQLSLLSFWIATVFGGIYALYLMKYKNKGGKTEMAFGPFIVIGAFIALICGKEIIYFYLSL